MCAYHMSERLHPVGTILMGNGKPKVGQKIEDALQSHRPTACFSRLDSVFCREMPDFHMVGVDCGYIYRVAIRGDYQRYDANWIGELQKAELKPKLLKSNAIIQKLARQWPDWTDELVASACRNYWTAVASNKPLWELLCYEAEVEIQLSSNPILARATKGGWKPPAGA